LISGADEALVYDSLKNAKLESKSKKVFGIWHSMHLAGLFFAPPIGSFLAVSLGLQAPMAFMAIPSMISFVICLTLKEPKTTKKQESRRYLEIASKGLKYFIKKKELKILAVDFIVFAVIAYYVIWSYQLVLQKSGIDLVHFGLVHAGFVLSQILVINSYSWIEKNSAQKAHF